MLAALGCLAVTCVAGYFVVRAASNSADLAAHRAISAHLQGGGGPGQKFERDFDAAWNGIGAIAITVSIIGTIFACICIALIMAVRLILGPPRAGRTPSATIQKFYRGVLDDNHLPGGEFTKRLSGFVCLTERAMHEFNSFDDFETHWGQIRRLLKRGLANNSTTVRDVKLENKTDTSWTYSAIVEAAPAEAVGSVRVSGARSTFLVSGCVILSNKRWYVASGKWSGEEVKRKISDYYNAR